MRALVGQLQKLDIETSTLQPVHLVTGEVFFTLSVPRRHAYPLWHTLRKQMTMTAHWPLILGTDEDATYYQQDVTDPDLDSVTQIISNAHVLNRHIWLSNRLRWLGYAPRHEDPDPDRQSIDEAPGPWLAEITPKWRSWYELPIFPRNTSDGTLVIVGLFPTTKCWEVPAWLKYGNWNACPEAEGHVLLWHHWYQQFDAEPMALAADTLEFCVQRPPTNKPAALQLAYEHFAYCPDRAEEDVKLIASLAALLLNTNRWFFWWD
jgi:Domain of unknown function (DUF4253)